MNNSDDNKKIHTEDQNSSIKSRLRSAKKNGIVKQLFVLILMRLKHYVCLFIYIDILSNKSKKINSDIIKHVTPNEEKKNVDNNIILFIHDDSKETVIKNYDLESNKEVLQPNGFNVMNNLSNPGIIQGII